MLLGDRTGDRNLTMHPIGFLLASAGTCWVGEEKVGKELAWSSAFIRAPNFT